MSEISRASMGAMVAVAVALGATGAIGAEPVRIASPLRVVDGGTPGLTTALELDPDGYAALGRVSEAELTGFVLAPGRVVDLEVERFDVFAPDATVVRGTDAGDVPMPWPEVTLLRGRIAGEPGSRVVLGLSPHGVNGLVHAADGRYVLSSGPAAGDQPIVVYNLDALPDGAIEWEPLRCAADELIHPLRPLVGPPAGVGSPRGAPCRVAVVAIETDWEYYDDVFDRDQAAASAYLATLVGAVSEIYQAEINTTLQIGFMRLWTTSNDPYQANAYNRLFEFRDYWEANMGHVVRHGAHIISGLADGSTGGVAWVDALCFPEYNYALSSHMNGFFPYPLQDFHAQNWDLMVVAHEWGHNFGAPHTHDMSPPIDRCADGDCSPSQGTIMSYCHLCSGGMTNIELVLHPRIINEEILPYLDWAAGEGLCNLIADGPQVTQQPDDAAVCAGEPVTFEVQAAGSGLSYQWRRDGVAIPGATDDTHTIAAASDDDEGDYDCVVSNGCGETVSEAATLAVQTCPADLNGDCDLTVDDFTTFRGLFLQGDAAADLDGDGQHTVTDFTTFRNLFLAGCS